ncbi:MAG: indolepyruvate oxidoreductase subunit beta [Candidatus Syntrophonatronum acetioxidans]|uniref:Indolepyruvate oxidoreductase subunit beta n=1 Tax=Candidatus Syntrophonatronum acetioxidans TaxID=1795816 RepID=A0A424YF19_9FIRM|nr:MAG: indolepyruvate oxidoreductase subunit beta [Candidatus Syntrophonatronum acetioxidans]
MSNTINMLLVGVGGQGTILASRIIASVAQSRGLSVKLSEVHGMAQRGGSVVTYLRMGEEIFSPLIERGQADIILAFEQLEAWRALPFLKEEGTVVVNSQVIYPVPVILGYKKYPSEILSRLKKNTSRVLEVDAPALAQKAGNDRTVNVALLGVLARQMEFAQEDWEKALKNTIPARVLEPNLKAFQYGYGEG